MLDGLDAELAENAELLGEPLQWSTEEKDIRERIAKAIDKLQDLERRYWASSDDNGRVKLSGEIRLLDQAVVRWLRQVHTDVPVAPSRTSQKARAAVMVRWDRERARNG